MKQLICLFGIESPGLTSSLSLAEDVADAVAA
jgi:L-2-hydroxyglutarate oxidase LhgO